MKCPFCSFEFDAACAEKGCSSCGKAKGCGLLKCPRCGYGVLPEPAWAARLKKIFRKGKET